MQSLFNYAPTTYEAIIAAFIVLGLIQSLALRSKWHQAETLKKTVGDIAKAGLKAIAASLIEISKLQRHVVLASARADAMQERAVEAERTMMELQAEIDDAADNARGSPVNPASFFFGDSHFADGQGDKGDQLRDLFALLDKGRSGSALDDLIYGRGGPRVRMSDDNGDFIHGGPFTNNLAPGEPDRPFDPEDFYRSIVPRLNRGPSVEDFLRRGDLAGLERAVGAKVSGIQVIGQDGKPIEGAEKEALIREFFGADFAQAASHPSFDRIDLDPPLDPATANFGTEIHEEIEKHCGDSCGAPDESCSTQQPHNYAASSPRAG